jgi:hypothetical protein
VAFPLHVSTRYDLNPREIRGWELQMTRFFAGLTVLLVHTAAASAQQFPSAADTGALEGPPAPPAKGSAAPPPGAPAPAPPTAAAPAAPAEPAPAPAPAPAQAAPQPVPQPDDGYPPGYGPPPGYVPPPGYGPRPRPPTPAPVYYGPPPGYQRYPQFAPPPPRRLLDRPFTIGASAGFGGLGLDRDNRQSASEWGFAYSARLGFGLRPGLILMWDIERSVVDRGPSSYSQTANLAALQMFIGNRLFLRVGFGLAQADQDDLFHTDWGAAVMAGLGVELVQGWNWSFDLSSTITGARYAVGSREETWFNWSALAFGINFY